MKASMVNKDYITKELAPSYFLECLIYNSHNINFRKNSFVDISVAIINQFYRDYVTDECGPIEGWVEPYVEPPEGTPAPFATFQHVESATLYAFVKYWTQNPVPVKALFGDIGEWDVTGHS